MLNLEEEFRQLHRDGRIDDAAAAQAIALERGTLFSVSTELRICLYCGVAAVSGGIGLLLKNNLDRIGPVAVTLGLAALAAVCYGVSMRLMRRVAIGSMGPEYLLLLGALILSADVGYAESVYHLLGPHWQWYLLILALLHAATAYTFASTLVLSLSLTSLAAWFGVAMNVDVFLSNFHVSGWSALECAAVILVWREIHRRAGGMQKLQEVLEHFAMNLAFWGCIELCTQPETRIWAAVIALILGALSISFGLRSLREAFVVYGVIYLTIITCVVTDAWTSFGAGMLLVLLVLVICAAALLVHWHAWIKERR